MIISTNRLVTACNPQITHPQIKAPGGRKRLSLIQIIVLMHLHVYPAETILGLFSSFASFAIDRDGGSVDSGDHKKTNIASALIYLISTVF